MLHALRCFVASSFALTLALTSAPVFADMPADDGDGEASAPCDDKEEGDACTSSRGFDEDDFEGVCIGKSEGLECCDANGNCEGGVSSSGCAIAPGEPGSLVALGVFAAAGALWATRRRAARR